MDIKTERCEFAPAHMRWSAIDASTYDPGSPIGFGADEAAAIADLKQKLEER